MDDLLLVSTMALATQGPDGPHAAPVYFAAQPSSGLETLLDQGQASLRLYFFSDPESQHSRHLDANPLAAAAIYPAAKGWQDIRGLQLRGRVQRLPLGPQWENAWQCYLAKFPFVAVLKSVVARNALYVFTPTWLRLIDNARGFGFKQEWIRKDE
jgi:uncharacterized protein YhbP (UPF0306 family)